jgi:uncharacterized protein
MMTKTEILKYLESKKDEFREKYGITTLGLYGSYARGEATEASDVDIFYERDDGFELKSGFEFLRISDELALGLNTKKVDFVGLKYMNPIVRHCQKGFCICIKRKI